ncbi:BglG family transcription antiterminator [Alkalibacterium olivapovliticus]|uniref:BglG family transcription antiterminator n=1 Tax=Alkalibacterium olivapovliticus TaxID=99907 RepID=UPI001475A3D2|nr:BglG family transcription antiterminator [Alkalibacterium olivapovliticus]
MSIKNKRKLVEILVQSESYETADSLAEQLGVSKRTIYAYLDDIEPLINQTQALLEKRPGLGTKIMGDVNAKSSLLRSVHKQSSLDFDPQERQDLLLKELLNGKRISYYDLADRFYVSRSTIVKDMKAIKKQYFPQDNILSSNNEGTLMATDERTLQSIWGRYLTAKYALVNAHPPVLLDRYGCFIEDELDLPGSFVKNILLEIEQIGSVYDLADYYRINLFESLLVMSFRILKGHHHEKSGGYVFERVTELDTYYIAYDLAARLESDLDLVYMIEDKVFINECLIANGIKNVKLGDTSEYYTDLVDDLIIKTSHMMNEDLSGDHQLREGLLHHIIPMCFRLKNGIALQNPYIHEIKKQYSMMFHLTWYVVVDLEKEWGKRIPVDEIAFLMIHFQSALERKRDIKKILIISQTGLLTTEILERRIKQYLPSVHIYEVISEEKVEQVDLDKVDLIISTVSLKFTPSVVLTLSSIPSDGELKELAAKMEDYFTNQSHQLNQSGIDDPEHPLIESLSKRLSIVRGHVQSAKEAMTRLTLPLIDNGSVTEEYLSSVFEREDMSSTAFETGIAIPHGNPAYVKETQVSILINDKKISWGDERVDVVVLISVAKADISHISLIIEPLYEVMASRSDVERLFINQSDQSIYRLFARYH